MAKNKKMTRNAYKRRIITIGIMIFMSIALISTGFAAWVIYRDSTTSEQNGNIKIGVVNNELMLIDITNTPQTEFSFEPVDDEGRVRREGTETESLVLEVKGTVSNYEHLWHEIEDGNTVYYVHIKFDLSSNIIVDNINSAIDAFNADKAEEDKIARLDSYSKKVSDVVADAVAANYITNPYITQALFDESNTTGTFEGQTSTAVEVSSLGEQIKVKCYPNEAEGVVNFGFKIEFKWGNTFGGQNPSIYYDDPATGGSVSDNDVVDNLNDFRAKLFGLTSEQYEAIYLNKDFSCPEMDLPFKVIIEAKHNDLNTGSGI